MCARVGVHGQLRLLEAVLFIGVRAGENGCLRAGIDRHIFSDGVGQVKHAHGNIFLSVEIKIRTRTAPAAYSTPCRRDGEQHLLFPKVQGDRHSDGDELGQAVGKVHHVDIAQAVDDEHAEDRARQR